MVRTNACRQTENPRAYSTIHAHIRYHQRSAGHRDPRMSQSNNPRYDAATQQLPDAGKIVCVGRNYLEHIHELGNDVPR